MIANVFKIVFLSLVGFGLLIFLTAEKPKNIEANKNSVVTYDSLPSNFEVAGQNSKVAKESLIKTHNSFIIVGNHDSLEVITEIPNFIDVNKNLVLVANISKTPWLLKETLISSKLEELSKKSNIPMINDINGKFVESLNLYDSATTKFFLYEIQENKTLKKVYEGNVKEGALEGTMIKEEKQASLEGLKEYLN